MKKEGKTKLVSVVTSCYILLFHKIYKPSNITITKLEGIAIRTLAFRLTDKQIQHFNEILQKLNIDPLKDSDNISEKGRLFIDLLYLHFFPSTSDVTTVSEATTVNEKKEAWKKRVEAEGNLILILSDFGVPCHYRSVTSKGEMYCGDKKMPKEVCEGTQKRHMAMKRLCMPEKLKAKRKRGKATFSPNLYKPESGDKGATRLWRE